MMKCSARERERADGAGDVCLLKLQIVRIGTFLILPCLVLMTTGELHQTGELELSYVYLALQLIIC